MHPWVPSLIALSLLATPAAADEAPDAETPEAEAHTEAAADEELPFSVSVLTEVSIGAGTFTPGPAKRPHVNLYTKLTLSYAFESIGLEVLGKLSANVNAVENADSSNTVPHQVRLGDLALVARTSGLLTWDPIGLSISPQLALTFPTSLESQYASKVIGCQLGISVAIEPLSWLAFDARASITKNANLYTTAVLDAAQFDRPPLTRAGGTEAVANGRVAVGGGVTSWNSAYGIETLFTIVEGVTVLIDVEMLHLFSYQAISLDAYSSPYAHQGRGQSDYMYGTMEIGWEIIDEFALALGTIVEQTPLTSDNTAPRFPFWDTTNGSANRQVFYLDVIGSF